MDTSELLSNLPSPTLDLEEAEVQLDQQVTNALKSMNDVMERIESDFSNTLLSIPAVDVVTPPLLSISTVETNNAYKTILESDSSLEKGPSRSEASPSSTSTESRSLHNSLVQLTNRARFEMECKLRAWRSKQSKSFLSPSVLSSFPTSEQRKFHSAPTSPNRNNLREGIVVEPILDPTAPDSPQPLSYFSPPPSKSASFNEFDSQLVLTMVRKESSNFLLTKLTFYRLASIPSNSTCLKLQNHSR